MTRSHQRGLLIAGLVLVTAGLVGGAATGSGSWTHMGTGHGWTHMGTGLGWMMGGWDGSATTPPIPGAAEVEITATDFALSPTDITVTAGQPVNLTLVNEGSVPHNLAAAVLDLYVEAGPGSSSRVGLTPSEPGRYSIVCDFPGHADAGMQVALTVVAP